MTASAPGLNAAPPSPALLPQSFAGWTGGGLSTPAVDLSKADALREYGIKDTAQESYRRGPATMDAIAYRFADATGAYGAFTYLRRPGMHVLPQAKGVGQGAATDGQHTVFWAGVTTVETNAKSGSLSPAELNQLAAALPAVSGPESVAPPLPGHLPASGLDEVSVHYAVGPVAYTSMGGALPPVLIDFSREAEAVTAVYNEGSQRETLTLIEYPTPQIAAGREQAIRQAASTGGLPPAAAGLQARRVGTLLALATGPLPAGQARQLLAEVRVQETVTRNQAQGYVSEASKAARLLLNIAWLTVILAIAALVLGVFLGGGRALVRRMRGKPLSTLNDDDFISLKLSE